MRFTSAFILAAASIMAAPSFANEALAKTAGCTSCHKIDGKLIGPGYKQVAEKYKDDKNAEKALIEKVTNGGKGVWGQIPMPDNKALKAEDIKTLVKWVLAQK
ncbi:MAG: hypothetical protein RLZZ502_429 [Pseudomonadota bacterium]|jgi:cytochrome c